MNYHCHNGDVEHTNHDFLQSIWQLSWPLLLPLWLWFVMRCIYLSLEKWSTKMVATLYLLLVSFPLSWAINLTCMLIIWSIDTHSPGFLALKIGLQSLWDGFVLHGFFMNTKWHPAPVGDKTLERCMGISPNFSTMSCAIVSCGHAIKAIKSVCHLLQMLLGYLLNWMVDLDQRKKSFFHLKRCDFGSIWAPQ